MTSQVGRIKIQLFLTLLLASILIVNGCGSASHILHLKKRPVVVFQPSHQSDTGENYNEAEVCNAIIEYAMVKPVKEISAVKVWSYNETGLHHAQQGSNTKRAHTVDLDSGKISGYAYELHESNGRNPDLFISVHNNGATNKNACWGYIHEGDQYEAVNRMLTEKFVETVCQASGLENGGVHGDSEPNRNDYRCAVTGKLSFFSIDENVNKAPYRILLEIGDNAVSRELLQNPTKQKAIGEAIRETLKVILGLMAKN